MTTAAFTSKFQPGRGRDVFVVAQDLANLIKKEATVLVEAGYVVDPKSIRVSANESEWSDKGALLVSFEATR